MGPGEIAAVKKKIIEAKGRSRKDFFLEEGIDRAAKQGLAARRRNGLELDGKVKVLNQLFGA